MDTLLRDLRHASAEQLALRLAVVAATLLFVVLGMLVGGHAILDPWMVLVPTGLALMAAVVPQRSLPLMLLGWLVLVWLLGESEPTDLAALPAGAALLVIHTACALAAPLPVRASIPAELWSRALRRMGAVLAVVILLWGALRLLTAAAPGPGPWGTLSVIAGAGVVVCAVTAYDRWVRHRGAEQRAGR